MPAFLNEPLTASFLFMISTSTRPASNSHFLFSFPSVLLLFYFGGGVDMPACAVLSPLHRLPPPVCFRRPTPSPAGRRSARTWPHGRRAPPVAGGAATTGKGVTVAWTFRTPVLLWRNSVSSVIPLILCLCAPRFLFSVCIRLPQFPLFCSPKPK